MRTNTPLTVPGSTWQRPNGKWTAQSGQITKDRRVVAPRRTLGTFDTKEEADEARVRHILIEDPPVMSADETTVVSEYLAGWLAGTIREREATGDLARSTRRDYQQVVGSHIVPALGHLRIKDLIPARVVAWLRLLRVKGLSERTVQKVWRVLYKALEDADLDRNPARLPKKDRPKARRKRVVRPTVDDVNEFLDHVARCGATGARPLELYWRLAATTGLRRSEACGLTWADLEIDNGNPTLTVRRGLHPIGKRLYVSPPKSDESHRTIGLSERLTDSLRDHHETLEAGPIAVEGDSQQQP